LRSAKVIFSQILQWLSTIVDVYSSRSHFGSASPFKVQFNFDIYLFEGQIDVNTLEKWLSLLEGYLSIQKLSNSEKIIFTLYKDLPHVKYWWETYYKKHVGDDSAIFGLEPTWEIFINSLKEQYYSVRNYDVQYMRWKNLCQERDQKMPEYSNIFHTLCTKMRIKDSQRYPILKYHGGLQRYIQI